MERIIKALFHHKQNKMIVLDFRRHILQFVFLAYTLFLAYKLLLGSERFMSRDLLISNRYIYFNLIPFKTISRYFEYFSYFKFWDWVINIFGNVIIFIPMGILIPLMNRNKKSFLLSIVIGLIFVLNIELLQHYFGLGVFDVDDIILNISGVCFGYICYKILRSLLKQFLQN